MAVLAAMLLSATSVGAQTLSWGPGGAGGSGTWDNVTANWFDGSNAVPWAGGGTAVFGGAAGTVTVSGTVAVGGATFNTNGYTITGGTLTLSGTTATITMNAGVSATISSLVAGSAALVKTGTGTLTISNAANTYTGGTTISQGTLVFGGNGALGSGTVTLGDANTGTSNVSLLSNFANFLSGQNFLNNIVVSSSGTGTVSIGTIPINFGLNAMQFAGTITLNRDVTLVDGTPNRTSFLGQITGTGNITIAGARVTLGNSTNNFVGNVTINPGSQLQTDAANVIPQTATVSMLANSVLQFNNTGAQTFDALNGPSSAILRVVAGGPPNVTVGAANGSGSFAGVIQSVISSFTKAGAGTQVLSGASTYVGVTRISGGILSTPLLANGGAASGIGASASAAANLVLNGGTLQYTGTGASTNRLFTLTTNGGGIDASGSGALTFGNIGSVALSGAGARSLTLTGSNTGANTFASILADGGGPTSLVKTGAGTWVLTGANSYTGGTAINGGTLQVSADNNLGAATGVLSFDGGTLATTATFATGRTTILNPGGGTIDVAPGTVLTMGGAIEGAGALAKTDTGTLVLTGTNTYTGGTTIAAGILQVGTGGMSGTLGTGAVTNDGVLIFNRSDVATFGGAIVGTGAVQQIGAGTTVLTGDSTYTGGTTIAAGALQLGNGGSTGSITGDVTNDGALIFNRGDTYTFGGVIAGSGTVQQIGPGTTVLNTVNPYTGGTTVLAGTLAVGDPSHPTAALSGGGAIAVAAGATLGGYGSVTGNVTNNGTIAVANAVPAFGSPSGSFTINGSLTNAGTIVLGEAGMIGNRLIVVGDYVGQGGIIALNAQLAGDGAPADLLVIDGGTATGSTSLLVTNVGGVGALTAGNGIQVVQVAGGGTTAASAFILGNPGGYAAAGPYAYTLFRGSRDGSDPQGWYLRSTLDCGLAASAAVCALSNPADPAAAVVANFRPEVSLYAATPGLALRYGGILLDSLHERMGEERWLGRPAGDSHLGWARVFGGGGDRNGGSLGIYGSDGPSYDYQYYAVQVGLDLLRREGRNRSTNRAGLYIAYGRMNAQVEAVGWGAAGSSVLTGWSAGAYYTHFGSAGWYVDAVAQGTWYDVSASNRVSGLELKTTGFGFASSLEGGYPFRLAEHWRIEPQLQLVYQTINLDGATESGNLPGPGTRVSFGDVESLTGRAGVRLVRTWSGDRDGPVPAMSGAGWLRLSLVHEFLADPTTSFASAGGPVPISTSLTGTGLQLRAGFDGELPRGVSLYLSAGATFGLADQGNAYDGKLGFRIVF